jgi:GntR family transcriptional regulator
MATSSVPDVLTRPVTAAPGQPLRVAVYSRLADAIRAEQFARGSLLPSEPELGTMLGVSRTVVREALMLLEEDGLIVTRRGIGRTVVNRLPAVGLENLRPFEQVLATPEDQVRIATHEFGLQPTTDFISRGLELDAAANTWFRESLAYRGDEPVAIVQEHMPAGRYLSDISRPLADRVAGYGDKEGTLLRLVLDDVGPVLGSGECDITVGTAGATRGRLLRLKEDSPVLVLTQRAALGGAPLYLAKCIVSGTAGQLSIVQSSSV